MYMGYGMRTATHASDDMLCEVEVLQGWHCRDDRLLRQAVFLPSCPVTPRTSIGACRHAKKQIPLGPWMKRTAFASEGPQCSAAGMEKSWN